MGDHGHGVVSEATAAIPEQRALAAGVTRLHELLVARRQADIFDFPRRPDGSCQLLAGSFIRRLLSGELELKGCVEADVSAAQPDLKLLSAEQLLAIRVKTLTFRTDSETHRAHNSFIGTTDALLLETLGRRFLWECQSPSCERLPEGEPPAGAGPAAPGDGGGGRPVAAELLRGLGLRVVQVLGVVEACRSGWCSSAAGRGEEARGGAAALPACWAFELAPELWPDAQALVINVEDLWAAPTAGRPEDFVALAAGAEIVVPLDQSSGVGKDRQLRWEMRMLDPKRHDVLAELRGSDCAGVLAKAQLHLASELQETLERRKEACPDKSWLSSPRAARDAGLGSADSGPAGEVVPRCNDSRLACHGGKYAGVLGPDGTKHRYRRHRGAVSPDTNAETPETAFADESLEELRAPSDDGAGSAPASLGFGPPWRQLLWEQPPAAEEPPAAQDRSLWSYFDFWGASSAPEPAPVVLPAGPPRLRVRERKAGRGLCGIDPDDMCGEVEDIEVEGDRSLYKIPQAYPALAVPGAAEPGRRRAGSGAAVLLGQAGI